MNLAEQMNDDLDLILDQDAHAEPCYFLPRGQGGTSYPTTVLRGDASASEGGEIAHGTSAQPRFLAKLSVLRAAILAQEGEARDPGSGDQLQMGDQIATVTAPEFEPPASDAVWLTCSIALLNTFTVARRD